MDIRPKPIHSQYVRPGNLKHLQQDFEGKKTHIVLVARDSYKSLEELHGHLEKSLGQFNASEPHVFLYSETPFHGNYAPERKESKLWVGKISELLKGRHPLSCVAFSVFEKRRPPAAGNGNGKAPSNTGYLISAGRYSAYPKIEDAKGDEKIAKLLEADEEAFKSNWKKGRRGST